MKKNKRISLGTIIYLSTVSLAAFLLSLWALWVWLNVKASLHNEAGSHILDLSRQMRDELDFGIRERYQDIKILSSHTEFQSTDRLIQKNVIQLIKTHNANFVWIGFVLADGRVVAGTNGHLEGKNVAKHPWFSEVVKTGKTYAGDVHDPLFNDEFLLEMNGRKSRFLDVASPVKDRNGKLIGVLGAHLDWKWAEQINKSVMSFSNKALIEGIIVDKMGRVILGPADLIGQQLDIEKYKLNQETWSETTWPDGIEYVSATSRSGDIEDFPSLGWRIIVREPSSIAYASIYKLRTHLIFVSLVFFLLLTLFAVIIARHIVRPIEKLTAASRKIRQSNGTDRIPHMKEYREVEELSYALGAMIDELESRALKLHEAESLVMESQIAMRVAEASNQAKSAFLASMSHELRTPLNAILGFAQLVAMSSEKDSDVMLSIQHILKGGDHLLKLINQVLDLAKIESGKISYNLMLLEPAKLLRANIDYLTPLAKSHSIEMHLEVKDASMTFIRVDSMRMNQILNNLISNAIKYNRKGGKVDVKLFVNSGGNICFSVEDTGLGIPDEHRDRVFEEFNRMGRELSGIEGTGIGLTITKQLVEHMGGTISFESKEGIGTKFIVEFPPAREEFVSKIETEFPDSYANVRLEQDSAEILYVEENQENIDLMAKIIAHLSNARLLVSRTGEDCIVIAREKHPDIIIMDINLPGMSGFDALMILKADSKTADIPVIALSASAKQSDIKRGIEAGFVHYLTKPIKVEELIHTLNQVIKD